MIQQYKESDLEEVKIIHSKFYGGEFPISDFQDTHSLTKYTVRNDDNDIITVANVRAIAEVVAITNKDISVRERREALYKLLQACLFGAESFGFPQIHVFVQDPSWERHLKKVGFKETKGKMLVYG